MPKSQQGPIIGILACADNLFSNIFFEYVYFIIVISHGALHTNNVSVNFYFQFQTELNAKHLGLDLYTIIIRLYWNEQIYNCLKMELLF